MTGESVRAPNGLTYERSADPQYGTFWVASAGQDNPDKKPELMCVCHNQTFTVRFESYEVFARCTACGLEESIYSG